MSLQWITQVLGSRKQGIPPHPSTGGERCVLISLANHADEDGYCYPSLATIASEAGLSSDEQVRRVMKRLVEKGWVDRSIKGCPDLRIALDVRPNLYRIVPIELRDDPPREEGASEERPPSGGCDDPPPEGVTTPLEKGGKPSVEPSVEPSLPPGPAGTLFGDLPKVAPVAGAEDPAFVAFWAVYPRKLERKNAYRAWKSAVKRETAEAITEAARRYAADPRRKPDFTKHASSWLNGDCWADYGGRDEPGSERAERREAERKKRILSGFEVPKAGPVDPSLYEWNPGSQPNEPS